MNGALKWLELIDDWIYMGKDVYIMFYEELKEDPVKEIGKLLVFLGLPKDERRFSCLLQNLSGSFHRTVHQTVDPFTADHHKVIKYAIQKASKMINLHAGKNLPIEKYEFYKQK